MHTDQFSSDQLVSLAEAYAAHMGLKISTVSTYAANDGKWLEHIRNADGGCTLRKARTVLQWFSTNWPSDLAWPAGIDRPAPASAPSTAVASTPTRKTKRAA